MNGSTSLDALMAQIEVQRGRLRGVLLTSPRRRDPISSAAHDLSRGLTARNVAARLIELTDRPRSPSTVADASSASEDAAHHILERGAIGSVADARAVLEGHSGLTVVSAPGILDDPAAVFFASACDVVLLAVIRGKSVRADVERSRLDLESAGRELAGAVLIE